MPILKLQNRLTSLPARGAKPRVTTQEMRLWHKKAAPWSGGARMLDSSPVGTNTGALYTGRALDFDGVNDTVDIGNTGQTIKSLVFYVNPDTGTQKFLELQAAGAVDVGCSAGTVTAAGWSSPTIYVDGAPGSTITAGTWHQVVVTSATGVSANAVTLGKSGSTYFAGQIADVRMYSVQLSAAQVTELYANPENALPIGVNNVELVGWWKLHEAYNDATYKNIHWNSAVLSPIGRANGATQVTTVNSLTRQSALKGFGKRLYFTGSNYVNIGSTINYGQKVTLSAWVLFNRTIGERDGIIASAFWTSNNFSFHQHDTVPYRIYFTSDNGNYAFWDINNGNLNTIYHLCLVYDTSESFSVKLYVNGILQALHASSGTMNLDLKSDNGLKIGRGDTYFNGIIFNASIYTSAFTQIEVTELYQLGIAGNQLTHSKAASIAGYWVNDGIDGTSWQDLSGAGNHGTIIGGAVSAITTEGLTSGKDDIGLALNYVNNGELILNADGYERITDDATLDITSAITIEAWVKTFTNSVLQTVTGKENAYSLNITNAGKVQFQRWTSGSPGTVLSTATLTPGAWYHISCTHDGTNTKIYVNGVLDSTSAALTGAIDASTNDLFIGALNSTTQLFAGIIDSVKIYARVLSASEINNNYNAEKNSHQN